MKYVLMFADTEEFAADLAAMEESERGRAFARVMEWFAGNRTRTTGSG